MLEEKVLWSQKAQSKSDSYKNFGYMLYEIIGGRLTLLAFLSLFSFSGYYLGYFGQFLSLAIGVILFYAVLDAFNIFWTGIKLEYAVTDKAIMFLWGASSDGALRIPFNEITKISAEYEPNNKRSAIIFENVHHFKNGDFGFSQERYFKELSFENVSEIEKLINILRQVYPKPIELVQSDERIAWEDRLPKSNLYLKFLQLLAFSFLYFSTTFVLKIIDYNFIGTEKVVDIVVHQEFKDKGTLGMFSHLTTKNNYKIKLAVNPKFQKNYLNKTVNFETSRLFNEVVKFNSIQAPHRYESHVTGYKGISVFSKLFTLALMLFSCFHIFSKRGIVPFRELSILILAPIISLLISYFLLT